MTHDFMKPQPVAADIYFLRMILHDWSDKFCVSILRNTVAAMRPGSRILIMDAVLPPAGDWPTILERGARAADLQMGLLFNAKERDIEQWKELFSAADPRLEIRSVTSPPRSLMSIIEVGFAEGKNGLS
jgi:6-hydroxytryprostatin B O-methyltransferase